MLCEAPAERGNLFAPDPHVGSGLHEDDEPVGSRDDGDHEHRNAQQGHTNNSSFITA